MNRKRIIAMATGLLLLTVLAAPAGAQNQRESKESNGGKRKLEGTWLVTATFTDPEGIPPFKVLFTFNTGRDEDEGTLVDTNELQFTPNPICTPDQGVWERKGDRDFIATHLNFCFDAFNGYIPAGPTKVRDKIKLSKDGESFDMTQYVEGFDPDGNLVFVGTVNAHGVRVKAEAPPKP